MMPSNITETVMLDLKVGSALKVMIHSTYTGTLIHILWKFKNSPCQRMVAQPYIHTILLDTGI